jgi:aspartate racemase
MSQFKKTIGILGGMGPETTVDFFRRLVKICESKYNCKHDEDFPKIVIITAPIPLVVEKINDEKLLLQMLSEGIKNLIAAGSNFISIPCNTVHYYFDEMQKFSSIPILNIVDETARRAKEQGYKKVGILATRTTIEKNLYKKFLDRYGIETINPNDDEIEKISEAIYNIEQGKLLETNLNKLKKVMKNLEERGAEAVILGCTELPILIKQEDCETKVLDTTQILAERTIEHSVQ